MRRGSRRKGRRENAGGHKVHEPGRFRAVSLALCVSLGSPAIRCCSTRLRHLVVLAPHFPPIPRIRLSSLLPVICSVDLVAIIAQSIFYQHSIYVDLYLSTTSGSCGVPSFSFARTGLTGTCCLITFLFIHCPVVYINLIYRPRCCDPASVRSMTSVCLVMHHVQMSGWSRQLSLLLRTQIAGPGH